MKGRPGDGEERFWRLSGEVSGETWVSGHSDVLRTVPGGSAVADALVEAPDLAAVLGLVGGLAVDPPYG